jgi:hypothetical protein
MPLKFNCWHDFDASQNYSSPDLADIQCNLTPGRRIMQQGTEVGFFLTYGQAYTFQMEMLIPKLTDIRCQSLDQANPDLIECPAGSGRMYAVAYVDDIGKGFANEHRLVMMNRMLSDVGFNDATIPVPVPLP